MGRCGPRRPSLPFRGSTTAASLSAVPDRVELVGLGNLRVPIERDGSLWVAQGLEVDYLALGHTVAEAEKHFEDGLAATVGEHLLVHGNLDHLLAPAPPAVWRSFLKNAHRYSPIGFRALPGRSGALPFGGIAYYGRTEAGSDAARPRESA